MDRDWETSLPLVKTLPDGRLQVVPETVERLRQIVDPVRCISFNGPYRTGKSHLLNLIISNIFNKGNVFAVGSTVQAMTQGMWIWAGRNPRADDSSWILFMDTEGLFDIEKGDNLNDLNNFILSLLLSSTFVYNSLGTIDYQALEKLHYVSTVAETIRLRSDSVEDEEELGHDLVFPSFAWIVRDFHLAKSVDGKALTDDGYLENALQTKRDSSKASQLSVKRCLKEYFPSRRCFTLPRLVAVDGGAEGDVDPKKLLRGLTDYILTSPLKIYEGSRITGKLLGRLAEIFVPAVQSLETASHPRICVQDIMTQVNDEENAKVVARCFEEYRASLNSEAAKVLSKEGLFCVHLDLLNMVNMTFMTSSVGPIHAYYQLLTEKIQNYFEKVCTKKSLELEVSCAALWGRSRKEAIGETEQYAESGGYERFQERVQQLRTKCEAEGIFQSIEGRCFVTRKFTELEENDGKLIMKVDKTMTDILKRQEEKKLEDERKLEEAKVAESARKEADELAQKVKDCEERASTMMKTNLDEKKDTENAFLEERIKVLEREAAELELSGLQEEVENRNERKEKYEGMVKDKKDGALATWKKVGTVVGVIFASAANTFMALFDPLPEIKSVFTGIENLTKLC